jgi:hypothetical protein
MKHTINRHLLARSSFLGMVFFMLIIACTKEIELDLDGAQPQLVIIGNIADTDGPHQVTISKSVLFSDANQYPPVSGALVVIRDSIGIVDTLKEIKAGVYETGHLVGIPGHTYLLQVITEGKSYTAVTSMPTKVLFDSIRFNPVTIPGNAENYAAVPVFRDPAEVSNQYRFIQTVNGKLDAGYYVQNDFVSNGSINNRPLFSPDIDLKSGDTVRIEMRCIDQASYLYFFTLSQIASEGPGGGTTPTNPPNNITGNPALGYFAAYTSQTKTAIVK